MDLKPIRKKFIRVKTSGSRKLASTRWLQRQLNDPYVTQAKLQGYRSRAAFKLVEIDKKFKIFSKATRVIDLGSAPGSWTQVAMELMKDPQSVIAIDLLDMIPIEGVKFIKGDFLDSNVLNFIKESMGVEAYDIVMSDMAANTIGHAETDHLKIMNLCDQAFSFAKDILRPGGHFISKVFQGGTERQLLGEIKQYFSQVKHFKPESSRKDSKEMYLVALSFKGKKNYTSS